MTITWYVAQAANEDVQQYRYTSEKPPVEADEYARVCAERDELRRRVNAVPNHEIASLYDAYAYATAGWEPGKAEHFPAVLRYIMDEFPPEDEE